MKKSLLALAALSAFAGVAHAESSVELYGVLDVAIGTVQHQGSTDPNFPGSVNPVSANHATTSTTGMFAGGIQGSRWGLRGTEDLGGGTKAIFALESGIDLPSGAVNNAIAAQSNSSATAANSSLNGQLFNRQAWVGLSDAQLGTVKFGRNYSPIYDIAVDYDPVMNAQLFSPIGFSGSYGGGGGVSEQTRQDSSIKYSNKIGNVNFGAMYKMGGVAGSNTAQSAYSFNLGYEDAKFGVQAAYLNSTDAIKTGSDASGTLVASANNANAFFVAAKYKVTTEATIKVGYEHYALSASSDTFTAGASVYGYTAGAINSGVSGQSQPTNIYFIGGDYNVTSALNLAAGYYAVNAQAYDAKTGVTNTYYSFLADYKMSKRTDVYAGLMIAHYSDVNVSTSINYYNASGTNANNSIYAVGIRHKF